MRSITKFFTTLALSLALALPAGAAFVQGSFFTQNFATTNLTTAYTQISASLAKTTTGVMISNTASTAVYVATGAAGSEVDQIIVPASTAVPVFFPLVLSQASRVSMHTATGSISTGVVIFDFLYHVSY